MDVGASSGTGSLNIISGSTTLGAFGSPNSPFDNLSLPASDNLTLTGDLYVNGGLDFSRITNVTLGAASITLQTASDNGDIKLADSSVNGASELILNSGSGLIELGSVGNTTALSSLRIQNSGETRLLGDINSQEIDFSAANDITLLANLALTSDGGSIDLTGGNMDGAYRLDIAARDVRVANLGSATPLDGLEITTTASTTISGDVQIQSSTRENVLIDSNGLLKLTGTLSTQGGPLEIRTATTPELKGRIDSGGGQIRIVSTGADLAVAGDILSTGGELKLETDASMSIGVNASLSSSGGDISLSSPGLLAVYGAIDSGSGNLSLNISDLELGGSLGSTRSITIQSSQGIGLGDTANGLQLDGSELSRISTPELNLQTSAAIVVDNISVEQTANLSERIILAATGGAGSEIRFENNPSSFKFDLEAMADDGISALASISTEGSLALDGDANTRADTRDNIVLGDNVSLTSAGDFTLAAQTGDGLILQGDMGIDTRAGSGTVDLSEIAVNGGNDVNQSYSLSIQTDSGDILLGSLGETNPLDSVRIETTGDTTLTDDIYTRRADGMDFTNTSRLFIAKDLVLDSSQGNGQLLLGAPVEGPGGLTLRSGNGNVLLAAMGQSEALGSLQINSAGQTQFQGNVTTRGDIDLAAANDLLFTGSSLLRSQNGATITLSGGSLTAQDSFSLDTAGKVILAGQINAGTTIDFTRAGAITLMGPVTLQASAEDSSIFLGGQIEGDDDLTLAGGSLSASGTINVAGALDFTGLGQVSLTDDLNLQANRIDLTDTPVHGPGSLKLTAKEYISLAQLGSDTALAALRIDNPGSTLLAGDIVTQTAAGVDLGNASIIELSQDIDIDTRTGNGSIDLSGGALDGPRNLRLLAGNGEVLLGSLGQTTALGSLRIETSGETTLAASRITTQGEGILLADAARIRLEDEVMLSSSANTGRIEFSGQVEGPGSLSLDAGNGDILLSTLGNTQPLAALTVRANGQTLLAGDINTLGTIDFAQTSQILLQHDLSLSSADALIDLSGGDIDGMAALSLDAGSGDIRLGNIGSNEALSRLLVVSSGQTTLGGNISLQSTTPAIKAALPASRPRRSGDMASAIDFSRAQTVLLANDVIIDTQATDGQIDFSDSRIEGNQALQIKSGAGDILLGSAGLSAPLAKLDIETSGKLLLSKDINVQGDVLLTAGQLEQQAALTATLGQIEVRAVQDINMSSQASTQTQGKTIYYSSEQDDIRIALLDAGNGTVQVTARQGSVLSSVVSGTEVDSPPPNIAAGNITIYAKGNIGASSEETLVLQASDEITLDSPSNGIYINNTRGTPIQGPRTIIDVLADRRQATAEAQRVALEDSTPRYDVAARTSTPLFEILRPEARTAFSVVVKEGEIQTLNPEVPLLVRTTSGWELKRPLHAEPGDRRRKASADWF